MSFCYLYGIASFWNFVKAKEEMMSTALKTDTALEHINTISSPLRREPGTANPVARNQLGVSRDVTGSVAALRSFRVAVILPGPTELACARHNAA